jgi:hypothetical protein
MFFGAARLVLPLQEQDRSVDSVPKHTGLIS